MVDTRWYKVRNDLWGNKTRTLLVVLSIAIGVFCVGMLAGARGIILAGLADQYSAARPASATLIPDPFGQSLLRSVRQVPGVRTAEVRYSSNARIEIGKAAWHDAVLFAIPNFHRIQVNKVWPERGRWPPPPGTVLLERASLASLHAHIGERIRVEMPDGTQRLLRISGSAHDINQPATAVSGISYAYVSFPTLAWLGQPRAYNQLYVIVRGNTHDTAHIWRVAGGVRDVIERTGRRVAQVIVPPPGKLWVYDAVQSMLLLLTVLGAFSLCMSGFLVINTVSAQMTQQLYQIGIMKAVGVSRGQLVGMYVATIVGFCGMALAIAVPLGAFGALALISYSTHLLDFDTGGFGVSPQVLALEAGAGLGVPILAALGPIVTGSRITVREALGSHGTGGRRERAVNLDRGPRWLSSLPRPLLLSLGNTIRRRGRLALTLSAMILGGAIFIAVLSVRVSLLHTLDDVFGYRSYDAQITFVHPYRAALVQQEARGMPGIVKTEGWGMATARRSGAAGSATADISVVAPPAGSRLIKPVVLDGRWLEDRDRGAMVVNSDMVKDEPDLQVGHLATFDIDGRTTTWTVAGIVRGVQAGPIAYVDYRDLAHITGELGMIDRLQVVTTRHDAAFEARVARALEAHLKRAGLWISSTQTTADQRAILAANFDIIVVFLLVMAGLLAVVGGLGLMGTMGIGVLERTREIGIMRAIGASDRDTLQVVMVEGLVIAGLSWVVGTALAVPLSPALSGQVGGAFIHAPLHYSFSAAGAVLWLFLVLVIAGLASFAPAWRAVHLPVRDVLAYE